MKTRVNQTFTPVCDCHLGSPDLVPRRGVLLAFRLSALGYRTGPEAPTPQGTRAALNASVDRVYRPHWPTGNSMAAFEQRRTEFDLVSDSAVGRSVTICRADDLKGFLQQLSEQIALVLSWA